MKRELDEIEQAILDALNAFAEEHWDKKEKGIEQEGITERMFAKLGELGYNNGYGVCSKFGKTLEHDSEWLYDMIWYKNNADGHLETVDLVLESELNRSESHLKYDFEKILISNAKYKIFVCFNEANDDCPENIKKRIVFFQKCVDACRNLLSGDRVTVFIWDDWCSGEFEASPIIKA